MAVSKGCLRCWTWTWGGCESSICLAKERMVWSVLLFEYYSTRQVPSRWGCWRKVAIRLLPSKSSRLSVPG